MALQVRVPGVACLPLLKFSSTVVEDGLIYHGNRSWMCKVQFYSCAFWMPKPHRVNDRRGSRVPSAWNARFHYTRCGDVVFQSLVWRHEEGCPALELLCRDRAGIWLGLCGLVV
eukprot:s2248_g18.t1